MTDRVLAEQMRPASLDSLIGQDATVHSVQTQLASGRIPHLFIIYGPSGSGKTTLAKILAETLLQGKNDTNAPSSSRQSRQSRSANLREINAANHNGVDDVRALIESMRFRPLPPCPAKVVILDEAHKLTDPAQNALLTATEDAAGHVYYIFLHDRFHQTLARPASSDVRRVADAFDARARACTGSVGRRYSRHLQHEHEHEHKGQ